MNVNIASKENEMSALEKLETKRDRIQMQIHYLWEDVFSINPIGKPHEEWSKRTVPLHKAITALEKELKKLSK